MPGRTVTLEIRIKLADGKHPFVPAVITSNGRVKPFTGLVNGKEEQHKEGSYYIRWRENGRQPRACVGRDPQLALTKMQRKEQVLRSLSLGLKIEDEGDFNSPVVVADNAGCKPRITLVDAVTEYMAELRAKGRARKTLSAYDLALNRFVESCPVKHVAEVGRREIMAFMTCCRDKFGLSRRSIRNAVDLVTFFLAANGVTGLFNKGEKPKFTKKKPERYTPGQLEALYAASRPDDKLLWQFFAKTGMREHEVACAMYSDIGYTSMTKTIRVTDKVNLDFHPKDYEERVIPIPDSLAKAIASRRSAASSKLIFPNKDNRPDGHFLKKLKRAAKKAELDCKVFLHKFRVTFACNHHRNGVPARTIQAWLGHSDLETTLDYLAAEDIQDEHIRELVNSDDRMDNTSGNAARRPRLPEIRHLRRAVVRRTD
jgi:integrase/recombinase XerD